MRDHVRRAAAELSRDRPSQGWRESWAEQVVVATVTPGAASDGNAAVTVTWNGAEVPAVYLESYSPVVGHIVYVQVQPPAPLVILGRVLGKP
ncbi:hypothetical protein [Micromonospora echinospora]|uniref:hypothetical protein n=1 Tax=Micromonospora echinospora TaxID=1877 RepID=UPI003A8B00F6